MRTITFIRENGPIGIMTVVGFWSDGKGQSASWETFIGILIYGSMLGGSMAYFKFLLCYRGAPMQDSIVIV